MSVVPKFETQEYDDIFGKAWRGFSTGPWTEAIDVRNFIQTNYQPYAGDAGFLEGPTERTRNLFEKFDALLKQEREKGGVLDVDPTRVASLTSHPAGYLDKRNEVVVGLQTDAPLRRAVNPFGGIRMAKQACEAYGHTLDPQIERAFTDWAKTHNDGVFSIYNDEIRAARKSGVITGLPDAYGRGRIIGDYRRIALYGVDQLIRAKQADKAALSKRDMDAETMRLIEEVSDQIKALHDLKAMAATYGYDISVPAQSALEAVQWTYFGYLGAIKEQNGAAMSLGRVSTFLDVYFQRDIEEGNLDEVHAQEIVDDFVMKLRMARQLRTPEYNELFAGDPLWVTEVLGGMGEDGRTLVTRMSFRFLNSLYNLGPAPEPNTTVLWSESLPEGFKRFCAQVSIDTASIQYENDDLMRPIFGDDYGIACCVSAMKLGKQMQFFGARCNLPKTLLMALNGGRDEVSGAQVGPEMPVYDGDVLDYDAVQERFKTYVDWLCHLYVNTMNIIHYSHDKYAYEREQLALHDTEVERLMAFGIAGLSVTADSLSAIKHGRVKPIRDERGLITDFEVEGDFPAFGNDDDRVDSIAQQLVTDVNTTLKRYPTYRDAKHTLSILTITSNVVYGKKTGSTPDGRKLGEPFAPGANPMHERDKAGALASLNSVAKIPYDQCLDGVSCTFSVVPNTLGKTPEERITNLVNILDGYIHQTGHHINVNVLDRAKLIDAMDHPEKYPHLTIRVSGYAVNFVRLSRKHQQEVINRTFHAQL